jgi:uncharacterized protein
MTSDSSRRNFLASGLALPAGLAAGQNSPAATKPATAPACRTLGKSGLKVSTVGFGCMITSDASVVSRAIDRGITYFDTARVYQRGNNERMVGGCLQGKRDKVVLSSKSVARTAAEAMAHLETSLQELRTDHLDIWYMHSRDEAASIPDELVAVWENAKKQGKIRAIGISTHNPKAIVDRVLETGKFEVLLSTYNFTVGTNSDAAFKRLHDAGIGLVAMKVMAPARPGSAPNAQQLKNAGGPLAALKWAIKNPLFATAIPSMVDMEMLDENFRAMSEPFGAEDAKLLAVLNEQVRPLYCRMCYQCNGQCPKGVPVPDTIRYLSYADFYGQFALGREHFMALPQEVRDVRCGDCSSCAVHCPNGVHVAERLTRAQELFA